MLLLYFDITFKNCKHIFCKCKYTNKHAQANQHHGKTKSRIYIYTFIISKEPFQSTTTKPCAHCTFYMVLAFGWSMGNKSLSHYSFSIHYSTIWGWTLQTLFLETSEIEKVSWNDAIRPSCFSIPNLAFMQCWFLLLGFGWCIFPYIRCILPSCNFCFPISPTPLWAESSVD